MAAASVRADKVSAFVQHIADELRQSNARGVDRPVERRKVRTISEECGYNRASQERVGILRNRQPAPTGRNRGTEVGPQRSKRVDPSQAKHLSWHVYDVSFREVPVGPTAQ